MAKIDNERMWASMLNYEPTTEEMERISRALRSDRSFPFGVVKNILIRGALREQGLMEKDGEIVDYAPQFKAGDWVVHGTSTCCVSEVLGRQLMVIAPSLYGGVKTLYDAADVHLWTLADAKKGDYLTCDDGTESKVIFISHGCDDNLYLAYAGYATDKDEEIFFTDETCCLAKKEFIRPAKDGEKLILDERIAANGLRWNRDRMELEKVDHTVKAVFPDSDYEQMHRRKSDECKSNDRRSMMKAKELQIGDWIHSNFTNDDFQVWPSFLAQATNYGRDIDRTLEDICCEPILLTEEILKANGYEEVVGEKGMCGVTIAPYFKRDDSPRIYCDGNPFAVWFDDPVDIKYVHQLQHVLRLCGVEKEIKLKD